MSDVQREFIGVTLVAKANIYFDGKVVSHTFITADGARKTAGIIFPGNYHFGTERAERMQITAGDCLVKIDGASAIKKYAAGQQFDVAAKSGFDIEAKPGICEYICSYVD